MIIFEHRFNTGIGITVGALKLTGIVDAHVRRDNAAAVFALKRVFWPASFKSEDFIDQRSIDATSGEDAVFPEIDRFGTGKGLNAVLFGQDRDWAAKAARSSELAISSQSAN